VLSLTKLLKSFVDAPKIPLEAPFALAFANIFPGVEVDFAVSTETPKFVPGVPGEGAEEGPETMPGAVTNFALLDGRPRLLPLFPAEVGEEGLTVVGVRLDPRVLLDLEPIFDSSVPVSGLGGLVLSLVEFATAPAPVGITLRSESDVNLTAMFYPFPIR
jgi:hypothetical protein